MSISSEIPSHCTVLVIGGGPGGSYSAAALAREGISTVVLEAEKFPRYHVGESMLASMRHFLRFIDLDKTFDEYGFKKKVGAAFKLNGKNREGYTDFLASGGPDNYAWNVIRSEADEILFKHAGKSGANMFDGVKVDRLNFDELKTDESSSAMNGNIKGIGRPTSASYINSSTGSSGTIKFDYLIDASGRAGLLTSKYLKTRKFNQGLKNLANWGYWKNTDAYAVDTSRADSPYFEALTDESGWAWFIPLHNDTTSVGVVMNQELAVAKKRQYASTQEFYSASLKLAPNTTKLLGSGQLVTNIRSASDYSYSSSTYAIPYARVVGDAGCFIDPFFSSGVHLAFAGALSAATTICAAIRGHCNEESAAKWHSQKVADGYERFTLVVLSGYRQIRKQQEPVLADFDEDNFDRAFAFFRPIIQGTADICDKLTQAELSKTLDFCAYAFEANSPEERIEFLKKSSNNDVESLAATAEGSYDEKAGLFHANLTTEEESIAKRIRARKMMRMEDSLGIDNFRTDVIDGLAPFLKRGSLGLVPPT